MSNYIETIMDALRANPLAYAQARELALESVDESKSVIDRMAALVQLNALIGVVEMDIPKKPEYKWVNGARVRVKQ